MNNFEKKIIIIIISLLLFFSAHLIFGLEGRRNFFFFGFYVGNLFLDIVFGIAVIFQIYLVLIILREKK